MSDVLQKLLVHCHVTGERGETFCLALLGSEGQCGEAWPQHGEDREQDSASVPGSEPEFVTL